MSWLFSYCKDNIEHEPQPQRERWIFKYGTVVQGPCTISECRQKMLIAATYNETFFATHVVDDVYEVQFERNLFPDIIVFVNANSGLEAGHLARKALNKDYADTVPVSDS